MTSTNKRRAALVALVLGAVVIGRAWHDNASRDAAIVPPPHSDARSDAARDAQALAGRREPIPGDSIRSMPDVARSSAASAQSPVRLHVQAPTDVRVGDVFQARVDIEASAAVRDLVFSIAYEKSRLSLIGRSDGEFVHQPGVASDFGVDEPSDGYVEVVFRARDGSFATGVGTVVVLEFQAIKSGTSAIELHDVKSIGAGGDRNPNAPATQASVTIR